MAPSGAGEVNLTITDAPSDQWQEVSVVLKSASLRNASDRTWTQVWLADPANPLAGKVNLVDLNSVAHWSATAVPSPWEPMTSFSWSSTPTPPP